MVMLSVLPFLASFELLLQAVIPDIQATPKEPRGFGTLTRRLELHRFGIISLRVGLLLMNSAPVEAASVDIPNLRLSRCQEGQPAAGVLQK
jgi:hypothetical protein